MGKNHRYGHIADSFTLAFRVILAFEKQVALEPMTHWRGDYHCEMTINLLPMKICLKSLKEVTYTLQEKL